MSRVRTAANRIASLVVRYASAGSKEWAQAIESELSCIENDWKALAWSLGGFRVLYAIQPKPLGSIDELYGEAQKYANRRLHAVNNGWLGTNIYLFAPVVCCLIAILRIAMGQDIPASVVQLTGWLLLTPTLYLGSREPDVPDSDDQANLMKFYVDELSAKSRNSLPFWMFIAGVLLLICGWELEVSRGWGAGLPLPLMLLMCIPLFFLMLLLLGSFVATHVNNRRRFAQIERLLGDRSTD